MRLKPQVTLLLTSIILVSSLLAVPSLPLARAGPGTTIQVWSNQHSSNDIADPTFTPGTFLVLDVRANDLPPITDINNGGINGFDIAIEYDPSVMKAVAADWKAPLCPAEEGCLFATFTTIPLVRDIDSPPGTTRIAIVSTTTATHPFGRAEGTGTLFRIRFQVMGTGFTTAHIRDDSKITGPVGGSVVAVPYSPIDVRFDNRIPFALSADPIAGGGMPGQSVSTDINVTKVWTFQDFTELIALGVTGLPQDTLANFAPMNGVTPFISQLTLNTSPSTPGGAYSITITGTSDSSGFTSSTVYTLFIEVRDVAITSVTPSVTSALIGDTVPISVGVKNEGTMTETVDVELLAEATVIGTQTGITLTAQETQTLTFNWDTTGMAAGSYAISARVSPVPDEADLSDNTKSGGTVTLTTFDFAISIDPASGNVNQGGTTSPTVTVTISGSGTTVTLSHSGLPSGATASFAPSSGSVTFTSTMTITTSLSTQTGAFTITVTGEGDGLTRTATFTLNVQVNHDAAVSGALFDHTLVNIGSPVILSVTVANQGGGTETFNVDVYVVLSVSGAKTKIDTVQVSLGPGETRTITVTWATSGFNPGTYFPRAEIPALPGETDTGDNSLTGVTTVRLNAHPVARFVFTPATPRFGQDIQFDARSSSDQDGTILTYTWNFSDRTALVRTSLGNVGHGYTAAGTYTVTLIVTDNDGATGTTTQQVTVTPTDGGLPVPPLIPPLAIGGIVAAIILILAGLLLYRRSRAKPPPATPPRPAPRPNQRRP